MKKALRRAALRLVTPTKKDEKEMLELLDLLQPKLSSKLPRSVTVTPAGSVVKGTFLRGAGDIDLFALFPPSYSKERMFRVLKKAVAQAFPRGKREISYAEHPYVRLHLKGRRIDIVPAYLMLEGERIRSAVDRSQLHVKYVLHNISEEQKGDVRLLKRFLRVNGLYGAEIRVLGLSGYLCELLVLHYGDFESVINAVAEWQPPVSIDPLNHYMSREDVLRYFNSPPIVVVDPVDRERNVAAALTKENLARFILLARNFSEKPSLEYFREKKELRRNVLNNKLRVRNVCALEFPAPKVVEDILWGQLRRFAHMLKMHFEKEGFSVLGAFPHLEKGKAIIVFEVLEDELPRKRLVPGPYAHMASDCRKFIAAHKRAPILARDSRIYALVRRQVSTPKEAVKSFKDKLGKSFPSRIRARAKKAKFLSEKELLKYPKSLSAYFQSF